MPDEMLVKEHLLELEKALSVLERYQKLSEEQIARDTGILYAVLHGFQVAIQNLIDIAMHISMEHGEKKLEDYAQALLKLGELNVLPVEFAKKISGMAGLRNVIVHEYTQVDLKKLYHYLQNNLEDFYTFNTYILNFLNAPTDKP